MGDEEEMPGVEDIRRNFPTGIAFADELRAEFGNGVKLFYLREGSRELGERPKQQEGITPAEMVLREVQEEKPNIRRQRLKEQWKPTEEADK